jgi:hypothetical protein
VKIFSSTLKSSETELQSMTSSQQQPRFILIKPTPGASASTVSDATNQPTNDDESDRQSTTSSTLPPPLYTLSPLQSPDTGKPMLRKHLLIALLLLVTVGSLSVYIWMTGNRGPDTSTINVQGG